MAYVNQSRAVKVTLSDWLSALVDALKTSAAKRRIYNQTLRELRSLSDRDLADLGIHRMSITEIAQEAAYGK